MAVHGNNGRLAANSSIHTKNNTPTPMYMRSAMPPLPLPQQNPPHHYSYGNPTYGHLGYATGSQSAGSMGGGQQHSVYASSQYSSTQTTSYWCSSAGQQTHSRSDAALMYRHCRPHADKRKSAVELLAETKPFYVKTGDSVMDHGGGGYMGGGCGEQAGRKYVSPAKLHQGGGGGPPKVGGPQHMHHHHHHHGHRGHGGGGGGGGGRHANGGLSGGSLKLGGGRPSQMACNKLTKRGLEADRYCRGDLNHMSAYEASGRGQNQLPTTAIAYRNEPEEPSLLNVELPPTLSSLEDIYKLSDENSGGEEPLVLTENYRPISPPAEYAAETISISGNDMQHRGSGRYQRSYSHSQEADIVAYNINSHKSLPDLHTHINRQSPHSEILSCCSRGTSINRDSGGSSGHYTHRSEPCYQRQQRDSTVSVGGGGGGGGMGVSDHYVSVGGGGSGAGGASVPYLRDMRRDSGSSTQHSEYISPPSYSMQQQQQQHGGGGAHGGGDGLECHCKTPVQVDSSSSLQYDQYFGNFPTPEVPKAFQDDYSSVSKYSSTGYGQPSPHHHHSHTHSHGGGGSYYCYPNSGGDGGSYSNAAAPTTHPPSPQQQQHQQQQQQHVQMQQMAPMSQQPQIDDISPPPIQFKRQRCIRFKNHQRIPLPGAYAHPSDSAGAAAEYYHGGNETSLPQLPPPPPMSHQSQAAPQPPQVFIFPKYLPSDNSGGGGGQHMTRGSLDDHQQQYQQQSPAAKDYGGGDHEGGGGEQIGQLERFFDRLGLNEAKFHEIYSVPKHRKSTTSSGTGTTAGTTSDSDDSTVFFSDVSTVDSMRLPDSTETQPQATQSYRLSEPPSIVERNARIIKWLCNCKKMQQYA